MVESCRPSKCRWPLALVATIPSAIAIHNDRHRFAQAHLGEQFLQIRLRGLTREIADV
jgi:hypothetical protein